MGTHKDLEVWNDAIQLAARIYSLSGNFPQVEKFGLVSQIKRSAISIPSNIAEGAARQYTKEYIHFLYVALGSLSELETQLIISTRLGYISEEVELMKSIEYLSKRLYKLVSYLKQKNNQPTN